MGVVAEQKVRTLVFAVGFISAGLTSRADVCMVYVPSITLCIHLPRSTLHLANIQYITVPGDLLPQSPLFEPSVRSAGFATWP